MIKTDNIVFSDEESDAFASISEHEIVSLWETFKAAGLSGDDAWNAVLAGIALDLAFARSRNLPQVEQ
jgi:hypothetical protein